jgi:NADPH:quinone reductase-like Zn-dependent oxidoreductase
MEFQKRDGRRTIPELTPPAHHAGALSRRPEGRLPGEVANASSAGHVAWPPAAPIATRPGVPQTTPEETAMSRNASLRSALFALMLLPGSVLANPCIALPETMRAARIHAAGGPESLRIESVPLPTYAADEVLVRVHHASVNPVDWKLQAAGRLPFPAIPGGDFAGEVVARGDAVTTIECGALVAGIADQRARSGSYAQYVSLPASEVVPRPARFSSAEAAAYPTVSVAAWRFLVATAALQAGERVLIHGGAGGVGSMLVQIAKQRGAHVIATASPRNHDYLRSLGADEVIDYRSVRFEDVVANLDVVIDTVGGETLARSPAVLRDGGRLVTLVGQVPAELCAKGRIVCPVVATWDVAAGLAFVAPLIESGALRVNIDRTYPLDQIRDAQDASRAGHVRGKIVIDLGASPRPVTRTTPATRD